jgi:hypothetical protein
MAEPPPASGVSEEDWDSVLCELEAKYGFRHLDMDPPNVRCSFHNRMMLRDNDTGRLRPIVIDLEHYELVTSHELTS